ncbi:hypothetical protein HPP92_016994 [Vanilla planifolia]|uniref:DNA repair protein REV1 n=1 Tax=Vanilla planifolia TaxID=51239 RepID=A0A835QIL2_VANPL|nr:hypothetical protein HPP92_016994 [Vanilla planifolia]
MRSSSSSSVSRRPLKRSKSNQKAPVRKSPFTDFESYMKDKNRKLRSQFEAEASSSSLGNSESSPVFSGRGIFHGVSIFVNGHTIPSGQELKGYMLRHGGRFENYFSSQRVTHIICSNLPDSKMRNLKAFSRGLPVVKPEWVLDSVASNLLLSSAPYQIFGHSSETCKQQKLSAFFGCKSISCFKENDASDSNVRIDCEGSEKSMNSPLEPQSKLLRNFLGSDRVFPIRLDEEQKLTNSLDKVKKYEASDADSLKLSIRTTAPSDDGSFGKPTYLKQTANSDVHHSTFNDPNFVENYFKSSRLHFIGTWRNRYQKRFSNMLKGVGYGKEFVHSSSITKGSTIIHIDMDCFFVSVILRKYPDLLNEPVAVCHSDNSRGTAEISSANYPAREYGIRAGMFVRDAKACCHNLVVFPYDFEAYEEVADQFYSILHKHCNKVQAVSCDEAFLDITEYDDINPESFSSLIRKEIVETTKCTASAGIAGNMLMARLATKSAKPNGQCFIPPEKVDGFLEELPITSLPGIGHSIGEKLKAKELHTCGQLRMVSKVALHKDFGERVGDMLWSYCRGFDDRKVEVLKEAKSIGAEVNWGVRFQDIMDCEHFLFQLSKEVSSRLKECGVLARTVNLKKSYFYANSDKKEKKRCQEVRGVGLQMSRLERMELNRRVHQHNVLESWFLLHSKVEDELVRVCNATDGAENVPRLQRSLPPNENSCIEKANSLTAVRTARCSTDESARSALPPVSQLDMSIIKHLPTVIISEMNDAYNGMLYDFIGKQCKDAKSETRCSSLSEKHTYDEGQSFSAVHGKMQLCFDTSASDAQTKNEVELATGTSNATSVLRNFSDAHDLNKSTLMTGVLDYSANVADETSWISKHMESETSEHSKSISMVR